MGLLDVFKPVADIADRASKVFFEERNKRARVERDSLLAERKELLAGKCTVKMVLRTQAIDKRLAEINSYLSNG
jgi:hypothetical protein